MKIALGVSLSSNKLFLIERLVSAFRDRVIADGGVFEERRLYAAIPTNGNGDMAFTRATTATRVDENDLVSSVASNVPRIDYTGGGCPSILLEPQRTNLCFPSNNKNNVSAGDIQGTYVADTLISAPDNSTSAYKFTPTDLGSSLAGAAGSGNRFYFELTGSNTTYTNSVYVKSVSGSSFDFAIKVVNRSSDTEIASTTITVNNSWQRVSVTGLTTGAATGQRFVIKSEQAVYLWGFQIEAGAYPTSYIPTPSKCYKEC
jgi:hypothetical protein